MSKRSLGTLTLDLVARTGGFMAGMDKAERQSKKWRKQVETDMRVVGQAIAGASTAAVAGLAAVTASTIRTSEEVTRLSRIAGTTTTEFQKYAAGAQAAGIEQEKLADIFKDMSDRVGDFLQTGGGPLADFFEQIAPKVGVTADQFRNLSGPDALGLFVSSLEEANLSQNEMVFYLEAMASDASMLLPLLQDNAAGFKMFGDEAERAGAILNQDTIKAAREMQAAMFLMEQSATGMKNQISAQLLPVLADLSEEFTDVATDGAIAEDMGDALAGALKGVTATAVGAFASIQLMGRALAGFGGALETASEDAEWWEKLSPIAMVNHIRENWGKAEGILDASAEDLEDTITRYGNLLNGIWEAGGPDAGGENDTESRVKRLAEIWKEFEESVTAGRDSGLDSGDNSPLPDPETEEEKAQRIRDAYKAMTDALMTEEERLTNQARERLAILDQMENLTGTYDQESASRIASAATVDAPEFSGLSPEIGGPLAELGKIDAARERLTEWYDEQLAMLAQFRQERADLMSTWDEQEESIKREHEQKLADIEAARQQAQLVAAQSVFSDLADITRTFAGEQSGIYQAMFAVQKAASIAQSIMAIKTGIAMAAANPFPANLGAMATVATATAGIVSDISSIGMNLSGQAHDGIMSVPEDGTWNLKKGERVTTAETSAKLDATLNQVLRSTRAGNAAPIVNITENPDKAGTVNARQNDDGQWVIDVIVADALNGGPASKTYQSVFGMKRQGY